MQVQGTRSQSITFDISEYEVSQLINDGEYTEMGTMIHGAQMTWCKNVVGHSRDAFIKDGQWMVEWEDGGGGHSWTERKELGNATPEEIKIWEHFQALKEALHPFE